MSPPDDPNASLSPDDETGTQGHERSQSGNPRDTTPSQGPPGTPGASDGAPRAVLDRTVSVLIGKGSLDGRPPGHAVVEQMSLREFAARYTNFDRLTRQAIPDNTRESKRSLSWVVGGSCKTPRTRANVIDRGLLLLDYDAKTVPVSFEDMVARLTALGLAALVYTTPSHTEQSPRLRVVLVLADLITRHADYTATITAVAARIGLGEPLKDDPRQLDWEQLMYVPAMVAGVTPRHVLLEGVGVRVVQAPPDADDDDNAEDEQRPEHEGPQHKGWQKAIDLARTRYIGGNRHDNRVMLPGVLRRWGVLQAHALLFMLAVHKDLGDANGEKELRELVDDTYENDLADVGGIAGLKSHASWTDEHVEKLRKLMGIPKRRARKVRRPGRYDARETGLWLVRGNNDPDILLCSPAPKPIARGRDDTGRGWGVAYEWTDVEGRKQRFFLPAVLLKGTGDDARNEFLDRGVSLPHDARAQFLQWLTTAEPEDLLLVLDKPGWTMLADGTRQYVFPDTGQLRNGQQVVVRTSGATPPLAQRGTLEEWNAKLGAPAAGSSRTALLLAAAFVPPILPLIGEGNAILHIRGPSSSGKTTAMRIAASAWGGNGHNGYEKTWNTTQVGLEAVSVAHNHALLCLDELHLAGVHLSDSVYMVGNGQGRARGQRDGGARELQRFSLFAISTGEHGLTERLNLESRKSRTVTAGQEVRFIELDSDAGAGHGVFGALPDEMTADAFARSLTMASNTTYGTAIRHFIDKVGLDETRCVEFIRSKRAEWIKRYASDDLGGQATRVAHVMALVAACGELAVNIGALAWDVGIASQQVGRCFEDWLGLRASKKDDSDDTKMIGAVRAFLAAHGASRFAPLYVEEKVPNIACERNGDTRSARCQENTLIEGSGSQPACGCAVEWKATGRRLPYRRPVNNRAGWSDPETGDFFITTDTFRKEVVAEFPFAAVAKALKKAGLLRTDRDALQCRCSPKMGEQGNSPRPLCYAVRSAILSSDGTGEEAIGWKREDGRPPPDDEIPF